MGKVLDTLRHREAAPATPPVTADLKPHAAELAVPPQEPECDIPFIEIPESPRPKPDPSSKRLTVVSPSPAIAFKPASPLEPHPARAPAPELTVWHDPLSALAEQYRHVRDELLQQLQTQQARSLLFVPLNGECNHAATVLNLALALTEDGTRSVLLVEADLHNRRIATLLGLAAAPGWAELLAGMPATQLIQDSGWQRLHVIAAGNRLAGCTTARGAVETTLGELGQRYELLMLQAAAYDSAMTLTLAQTCDAMCWIVPKKQTEHVPAMPPFVRVLGSLVVAD